MKEHTGGCLCGHIRYRTTAEPDFPHFCTCRMCQKWSGAPVVAWVNFQRDKTVFDGPGGEPLLFRSSETSQRGCCPKCGAAICALDDGTDMICMTIATLDDVSTIVPESQSFPQSAPSWLRVSAVKD